MDVRVTVRRERVRAGASESGGRCGENRREVSMKSGNFDCKYRIETEIEGKESLVEGSKSDQE
jgi:hypothetical protein